MDRETFGKTLRMLTQRKPFRPFTVAMVNGDRLEWNSQMQSRFATVPRCILRLAAFQPGSIMKASAK